MGNDVACAVFCSALLEVFSDLLRHKRAGRLGNGACCPVAVGAVERACKAVEDEAAALPAVCLLACLGALAHEGLGAFHVAFSLRLSGGFFQGVGLVPEFFFLGCDFCPGCLTVSVKLLGDFPLQVEFFLYVFGVEGVG